MMCIQMFEGSEVSENECSTHLSRNHYRVAGWCQLQRAVHHAGGTAPGAVQVAWVDQCTETWRRIQLLRPPCDGAVHCLRNALTEGTAARSVLGQGHDGPNTLMLLYMLPHAVLQEFPTQACHNTRCRLLVAGSLACCVAPSMRLQAYLHWYCAEIALSLPKTVSGCVCERCNTRLRHPPVKNAVARLSRSCTLPA